MVVLIGILAVLAILVTWYFIPGRPSQAPFGSPAEFAQALEYLRTRGIEGGELRIQAKDDSRMSIVLVKHIVEPEKIELRGTVTDEAMRAGGYEALQAALAAQGIAAYGEGDLNGRRTLTLRTRSLAELKVFVQTAMDLGFGKAVIPDCVAYFRNVLISNMPSVTGVRN